MRLRRYLIERRTKAERIIVYHGTSSKFLHKILKQGLIVDPKAKVWKDDPNASVSQPSRQSLHGIYLAANWFTAYSAGNNAARKFGGNTIIVSVLFQPRASLPDEDNIRYHLDGLIGSALGIAGGFNSLYYPLTLALILKDPKGKGKKTIDNFVNGVASYMEQLNVDKRALKKETAINFLVAELTRSISHVYHKNKQSAWDIKRSWIEANNTLTGKYLTGSDEDQKIAEKLYKELDKIIPKSSEAEQNYLKALDAMTKMFKAETMQYKEDIYTNFRATEDITYRGRNRIICVAEIKEDQHIYKGVNLDSKEGYEKYLKHAKNQGEFEGYLDDAEEVDIIKVHYGKLPDDFIKEYKSRKGSKFIIEK